MAYSKYKTQIAIAAACVCMFALGMDFALGNGISGRILYPFCHVNVWHMLANLWCIASIAMSGFKDSFKLYVISYLICITAPDSGAITMGLSGLCYSLMGQLSWQALNKTKYHAFVLGFMSIGLLFPNKVNNLLHIYCYAVGVTAGFLSYACRRYHKGK